MELKITGEIADLLWLRQRLHDMRHNYERNRTHPEMVERLTRLIGGMTIGTAVGAAQQGGAQ